LGSLGPAPFLTVCSSLGSSLQPRRRDPYVQKKFVQNHSRKRVTAHSTWCNPIQSSLARNLRSWCNPIQSCLARNLRSFICTFLLDYSSKHVSKLCTFMCIISCVQ
jgi:hypothetical protein